MSKQNIFMFAIAVFIAALLLLLVSRPASHDVLRENFERRLDSISSNYKARLVTANNQIDSLSFAISEIDSVKSVTRYIFVKDQAALKRLAKHVKDSLIKALFSPDPSLDSSMFSNEVADGVLSLESEVNLMKALSKLDSNKILLLQSKIMLKDSVIKDCGEVLDQLAKTATANDRQQAAEIKKLKWWRRVLIGVASLAALL